MSLTVGHNADDARKRAQAEAFMNAGYGACYLQLPDIGRLVENALLHFDSVR